MKILVHTCCAPCLTYPKNWLLQSGFFPAAYYYNPNIFPEAEYVKRYFVLKKYAEDERVPLVFDFDAAKTKPGDCRSCYEIRLLKAAEYAKNNGFLVFTTTLLISPYQNHELIRECGMQSAELAGVDFLYHDFRKGYRESREISRQLNLYRQKYCGCQRSYDKIKKIAV